MRRIHCYTDTQGRTESGLSLTEVKRRMKKVGGSGYTQHFDRDGSFQESTPIILGNNARTTYRAEYNTSRKYNTRPEQGAAENRPSVDVQALLAEVTAKAKAEGVEEDNNIRLLELMEPALGNDAARISDTSYDSLLCTIHGRLYHEYRGMGRSVRRSKDIKQWKEKLKSNQ